MPVYKIVIEIFQGNGGQLQKEDSRIIIPDYSREGLCAWMYLGDGNQSYRVGQRFDYPQEAGRICHWLLDSLQGILSALRYGILLPWSYQGTPYEKMVDPKGITTEYVRCPDPTESGIVVKVIRSLLAE